MATTAAAVPAPSTVTNASPARHRHEDEFKTIFEITDDSLIEDFSCAFQGRAIMHGRMYITSKAIYFYSTIFTKTTKTLPFDDIISIQKRNTAMIFSNALEITMRDSTKHFFTSFMYRDDAYRVIMRAWRHWRKEHGDKDLDSQELSSEEVSDDDEDPFIATAGDQTELSESPAHDLISGSPATNDLSVDSNSAMGDRDAYSSGDERESSHVRKDSKDKKDKEEKKLKKKNSRKRLRSISHKKSKSKDAADELGDTDDDFITASDMLRKSKDENKMVEADMKKLDDSWVETLRGGKQRNTVSLPLKGGSTTPPMGRKSIVQTNPANTLLDNPTDEGIATAMMNGGTAPTNVGSSSASNSVGGSSNIGASNAGNGGASGADGANGNAADNNDRPPTQSECKHFHDEKPQKICEAEFDVSVVEFYNIFWSDAEFFSYLGRMQEFTELFVGNWQLSEENCCISRKVGYRAPVKAPIGPKSTRVEQQQRARFKTPSLLLIETSSISKDVPFGDSFLVEERWTLTEGPNKKTKCAIDVYLRWKKNAWGFKSQIEKKTAEYTKMNADKFVELAKKRVEEYKSGALKSMKPQIEPQAANLGAVVQTVANTAVEQAEVHDLPSPDTRVRRKKPREPSPEASEEEPQQATLTDKILGALTNIPFMVTFFLLAITLLFTVPSLVSLNRQVGALVAYTATLESNNQKLDEFGLQLKFLEHYNVYLTRILTNDSNIFKEQQKYWRANQDLTKKLQLMKEEIDKMQQELITADIDGSSKKAAKTADDKAYIDTLLAEQQVLVDSLKAKSASSTQPRVPTAESSSLLYYLYILFITLVIIGISTAWIMFGGKFPGKA
jgi:hypothetical protein